MSADTDFEKLASVFNKAGQEGKASFIKMLWSNQPEDVQTQLKPLLTPATWEALTQQ